MSYNIDQIEIIHSKGFSITLETFEQLRTKHSEESPEDSVFNSARWREARDGRLFPESFPWFGEFSGTSYERLIDTLSAFDGEADLVLTWEGGDSFEGLRLRDHKVTKHEVLMTLGEEETD